MAGPDDMNFVRLAKERPLAVNGVETLRLGLCQGYHPHGTNGESFLLDALNDAAGVTRLDGVRLDDRKCTLHKL